MRFCRFVVLLVICTFLSSVNAQSESAKRINSGETDDWVQTMIADLKYLSSDSLKGRETGTPEMVVASRFIVRRFRESGVLKFANGYVQKFSFVDKYKKRRNGANVVGYLGGTTNPSKYLVVTAHYDHLGIREGEIFNGADDNASGTAALFAIANFFAEHKPRHSIIFAAFDAEEKKSEGAKEFLRVANLNGLKLVLNVNLDMVSRSERNELYIAGTYHYPRLKPILKRVAKNASVNLLFGHDRPNESKEDWTLQSDHRVFHKKKIPFVYFGVEDHDDYHKPTDDFEKIKIEFYENSVRTIISAIRELDQNIDKPAEARKS